jgi:luciferase family oxidoreductase group 1
MLWSGSGFKIQESTFMSQLDSVALSMLELASMKDIDLGPAAALERALKTAQHVEALGFTRFWVAEHHNMDAIASSATTVLMGYLAAGTSSIRVGSGGIMLPNHPPLVVAEQIGTLASLYPGRIDLGLGRAPGTDPMTMRALRRTPAMSADNFPDEVLELQQLLGPRTPGQRIIAMPGTGSNVPIWLLGSSLFSAQLAAELGLPYSFASHFAPRMLMPAIELYRSKFKPSAQLERPYVMLGIPLVLAPTDDEAQFLATTTYQRILALFRGHSMLMKPPVESMDSLWSASEEQGVKDFLSMAVIGSPATARQQLQTLLEHTQADELIFTCDLYEFEHRLRSLSMVAELKS